MLISALIQEYLYSAALGQLRFLQYSAYFSITTVESGKWVTKFDHYGIKIGYLMYPIDISHGFRFFFYRLWAETAW